MMALQLPGARARRLGPRHRRGGRAAGRRVRRADRAAAPPGARDPRRDRRQAADLLALGYGLPCGARPGARRRRWGSGCSTMVGLLGITFVSAVPAINGLEGERADRVRRPLPPVRGRPDPAGRRRDATSGAASPAPFVVLALLSSRSPACSPCSSWSRATSPIPLLSGLYIGGAAQGLARVVGPFFNPNYFGLFAGMGIPLALGIAVGRSAPPPPRAADAADPRPGRARDAVPGRARGRRRRRAGVAVVPQPPAGRRARDRRAGRWARRDPAPRRRAARLALLRRRPRSTSRACPRATRSASSRSPPGRRCSCSTRCSASASASTST